ncbi:hypothetical protein C1646_689699 [Rhizophagus diaphanus]|nr:hypothetical protein C1646_689699 [Rhizophagus diaphanus] [Rhizophagus sp. MUCL 43196]
MSVKFSVNFIIYYLIIPEDILDASCSPSSLSNVALNLYFSRCSDKRLLQLKLISSSEVKYPGRP